MDAVADEGIAMPDENKPASAALSSAAEMRGRPAPDDARKPQSPLELKKVNWAFTLRSTLREFGEDQLTDLAASLTYYAVLSLFPALIALVAILSLFGQSGQAVTGLVEQMQTMGVIPASAVQTLQPVIETLTEAPAPGIGLVIGLVAAVWSASNYVKAFGRAMNRVYEVQEGRPALKLNLTMYALTAVLLVLVSLVLFGLAVSGPVTAALGRLLRLGDAVQAVWSWGKIPLLAVLIVVIVALLYHFTPNVRQPKMRWISVGAVVAIVIAVLASVAFGLYLTFQGNNSYTKTYGAFAGVIIFLFWLWIMNVALLFGAELDAELERARELQGGIEAEEQIQLPPKDTTAADKAEAKAKADIDEGRRLRVSAGASEGPAPSSEDEELERLAGPAGAHKITQDELKDVRKRSREQAKAEARAAKDAHEPIDHYPGR